MLFRSNMNILNPVTGTRYLILNPIGSQNSDGPVAWAGTAGTNLIANANDIIEYTGGRWIVSFDSTSSPNNIQYVTNITTSIQYKWTGRTWVKSYQGLYPGGEWSLVL